MLPDVRYRQQGIILSSEGEKFFEMGVGVMGDWVKVRCTGRYDNISFSIKTTYTLLLIYSH